MCLFKCFRVIVPSLAILIFVLPTYGGTLEDIKQNVVDNNTALADISATVDITYTDPEDFMPELAGTVWDDDWDGAAMKIGSGGEFRLVGAGLDARRIAYDGETMSIDDGATIVDSGEPYKEVDGGMETLTDPVGLINNNTWSLASGTFTVDGIQTYKITTTNYSMWVDTATKTKVIKVEFTGGTTSEYVIYSGYAYRENTAYFADTMSYYYGTASSITSYSTIDVGESFSAVTWELVH